MPAESFGGHYWIIFSLLGLTPLTFRTISLKSEAGRKKRIADYVAMLARGEAIYPQKAKS